LSSRIFDKCRFRIGGLGSSLGSGDLSSRIFDKCRFRIGGLGSSLGVRGYALETSAFYPRGKGFALKTSAD